MTEHEWDQEAQLGAMLSFLNGKISERKFRLVECAFLRRFWHLVGDSRSRRAVETAEWFADGDAGRADLHAAYADATTAFNEIIQSYPADMLVNGVGGFYGGAVSAAQHAARSNYDAPELFANLENPERFRNLANLEWYSNAAFPLGEGSSVDAGMDAVDAEQTAQVAILRDMFGNPFRPVPIKPAWLTKAVTSLASAAYQERILPSGHLDHARLAVLSDALEEAGCADAVILEHLRSPGPHVRGCWAVDLLTGRS